MAICLWRVNRAEPRDLGCVAVLEFASDWAPDDSHGDDDATAFRAELQQCAARRAMVPVMRGNERECLALCDRAERNRLRLLLKLTHLPLPIARVRCLREVMAYLPTATDAPRSRHSSASRREHPAR
jgi:hypothetical protein